MPAVIAFIVISLGTPLGSSALPPGDGRARLAALGRGPQTPAPQTPAQPSPASGNGRVTVTLALEGIRIPNVNVALRSVDGNVVVAQTTSDAIGEVTFPDIPPGRYLVRSTHDGFADNDSAPFTVTS